VYLIELDVEGGHSSIERIEGSVEKFLSSPSSYPCGGGDLDGTIEEVDLGSRLLEAKGDCDYLW
jgi:hypothetical protein